MILTDIEMEFITDIFIVKHKPIKEKTEREEKKKLFA